MNNDDMRSRINHIRATVDLPSLLLSYGVHLQKTGGGYTAKCIHHDDNNPSMSVYAADDHTRCFCHSCGFSEDVIGAYMRLSGDDFHEALDALDGGERKHNGKPFAVIKDEPPIKKVERIVSVPPEGTPPPIWKRANYRNDDDEWVSLGEPVKVWAYRTHDGAVWYYEARYERTTDDGEVKKEPRCWTWGQRGVQPPRWELGFPPAPRPLYGLQELPAAVQVLVCEGPKKAEAARAMLNGTTSVACVAWPGGVNGVSRADWSALDGKEVIISPDADDVGRKAADAVAAKLEGVASKVWILRTDDLPDGWDVADAEGWDKAQFIAHIKERKVEWSKPAPEPEPIPEPIPIPEPEQPRYEPHNRDDDHDWPEPANLFHKFTAPKLKRGLLPKVVEDFVFDRAHIMDADPSFGGLSCLVTAAGVLDDRLRIRVKEFDSWYESPRLWGCLVGEPSSGKTPMQNNVTEPLGALIKRVAAEDSKIAQRQELLDARYEKKWKEYKAAAIESDDHTVPLPTAAPRAERLRVKVKGFTMEKLEEVLRDCPRGIFVEVDELSGLISGLDAYKNGNKDRAQMLETFNGGAYQKDLIGRGSFTIPNWSCTVLGGIQPSKIRQLSFDLAGDGFLQRFLVVCSDHVGGKEVDEPSNKAAIQAWHDIVQHLWDIKPAEYVRMSPEASQARRKAMETVTAIIQSGMIGMGFVSHMGKWAGLTARMMMVFWAIDCASRGVHPESEPISGEVAEQAMRYMVEHLLPHAVSFYEDGLGQSDVADTAKLIAGQIIASGMTLLTTTWLHKSGPGRWRLGTQQLQNDSVNRLIEYGWILPANSINSATRRPTKFRVNPAVHDLFAHHRDTENERIKAMQEIGKRIREHNQC